MPRDIMMCRRLYFPDFIGGKVLVGSIFCLPKSSTRNLISSQLRGQYRRLIGSECGLLNLSRATISSFEADQGVSTADILLALKDILLESADILLPMEDILLTWSDTALAPADILLTLADILLAGVEWEAAG